MGELLVSVLVLLIFAIVLGAVIWVPLLLRKMDTRAEKASVGIELELMGISGSLIAIAGIASSHLGHFLLFWILTAYLFVRVVRRLHYDVMLALPVLFLLLFATTWVGWNHWPV